jgi:hypothetical protein
VPCQSQGHQSDSGRRRWPSCKSRQTDCNRIALREIGPVRTAVQQQHSWIRGVSESVVDHPLAIMRGEYVRPCAERGRHRLKLQQQLLDRIAHKDPRAGRARYCIP